MRGPYRTVYYRKKGSDPGDSDSDDPGSGGIRLPHPINTKPTAHHPRTINSKPSACLPRHVSGAFVCKSSRFNAQRSKFGITKQVDAKKAAHIKKRMRHKQYTK